MAQTANTNTCGPESERGKQNNAVLAQIGKVLKNHGTTPGDVVPNRAEARTIESARDIIRNRAASLQNNPGSPQLNSLKAIEVALTETILRNDLSFLTPDVLGKITQEIESSNRTLARYCSAQMQDNVVQR